MKATVALLVLAGSAPLALAQATFTPINLADTNALSADGRFVVGAANSHAAYWTRATGVITLNTGDTPRAEATAVSGDGSVIVGNNLSSTGGATSGWISQPGQPITAITFPGATAYNISCLSRDGSTVGGIVIRRAVDPFYHSVWNRAGEGRIIPEGSNYSSWLHGLSANGLKAVGSGSSGSGTWGMLWNSTYVWCQNLGMAPNTLQSNAYAMSADGRVVVGQMGTTQAYSAMVYTQDAAPELFAPLAGTTMARLLAVTDDGNTAGGYTGDAASNHRAVIWKRGVGLIDAAAFFASRGVPNAATLALGEISGISANGRVFAGRMSGGGSSFLIDLGSCGSADFNHDADSGTDADIEAFFRCLAGNCCATCDSADFNYDGDIGTDADIESFFRVLAGGHC